MKNLLKIGFVLLSVVMISSYVEAVTVVKTEDVPKYNYYNSRAEMYDADLDRLERRILKRTYSSNSLNARLNRLERALFNRCYSSWNPTKRINHILANYRDNNGNYLAEERYDRRNSVKRVKNRFIGQPTGFTPSFMDMPFGSGFGNNFGTGFNQSFGTNNSFGFINSIPAMTGAGIKILD